jgi:Zn-dependent protease with chaperone function
MDPVVPVVVPPLAAGIVAVMATGLAWAVATPLLRAFDSPTLPERLLRWSGQHRFVAVLAYVPVLFSGRHALWALPLAWLGLQITAHRVRRRAFGDTWTFVGQVSWNARVVVGTQGWWWSVLFAPAVLLYADASPSTVLGVGLALGVWLYFYNDVLRVVLGASRIVDPVLLQAFEPVLAASTIPRPRLWRAGPRGGRQINAFALGAMRGDVVLFFDGLLDEMTPGDAAAVLAHEIGHLEDFAARRWRVYSQGPLLVVGAVGTALAVGHLGWSDWIGILWFPALSVVLFSRILRSQQRETESDRRAVELCGDGDALIRALVTIHDRALVPRRFQPEFAQRATHPSLARRIQAIRALSGVAPTPIEPRAFAGDGVPRAVIFEAERIAFVSLGDESPDLADLAGLAQRARHLEALPYLELSSLHVEPGRDSGASLVAVDLRGETRRLRIADRDVAAVQTTLDAVDIRMGPPILPQRLPALAGRLAAVTAALVTLPLFAWSALATALLALVRPTAPALAAISAALLTTAALAMHQRSTTLDVLVLVATGLAAAALAVRRQRGDRARNAPFAWDGFLLAGFLVTGAAAVIPTWLILALGDVDLGRLHVAARAFATGAAGWAALGGLCLAVPRRLARITAGAAFTLAIAVAAAGSDTFRDRLAPDPLIAHAPPVSIADLAGPEDGRLSVAGAHWQVTLSPDARHVVLYPVEDGSERTKRYTVAGFDGWQRQIDADDVMFVDAGTLLVARWEQETLRLSAEPIRAAAPRWSVSIDDASTFGSIEVESSGRWRVEPYFDVETRDAPVRFEGRVGDAGVTRTPIRGIGPADDVSPEHGTAASGAAILVRREFTGRLHRLGWLLPDLTWRSVLERIGGTVPGVLARSRLAVDCSGPSLTSPTATCLAQTGEDTFIWEVAADTGPPRAIATMTGRIVARAYEDRTVLAFHDRDLLMLWRGTTQALRIARARACPCAHDGSYAAGHVATLTRVADRDVVLRYPFNPPR